jgi:hypothetical protein
MKRKITLTIALFISIVLVSLASGDSRVRAEPPQRFNWDTGLLTPGDGQILRVTVVENNETITIYGFRRIQYMPTACDGGVCRQAISAQTVSDPVTLAPHEAASIVMGNLIGTDAIRVIVTTSSRNARVNASLIDAATGETQVLIALLLP